MRLDDFSRAHGIQLTPEQKCTMDGNVRRAADQIIAGKGATYYGIGSAVARIVDVLLHDQRAILTITCRLSALPGLEGLTLSVPHLLGGQGALSPIPLRLNQDEEAALARSAGIIREAVESLDLH
jgi:L-lactate dehydrogenase